MAVTAKMIGQLMLMALNKEVNWTSDTIKIALYTGAMPVTAQDNWKYKSDIATITEITGTGYTAGGQALANKTITYTAGTNVIKLDADDNVWTSSTLSATCAIIYDDTGNAATSAILGYVDFGGTIVSSGGNFTVTHDSAGLFTSTAA
jgi:hypothetical protein